MQQSYRLIKKQEQWHFANEAELENFIWDNLKDIFNLTPLKRQHYIESNICDILAISKNKELVIIELKNMVDRYVIQQTTRYYHALLQEKPFADQVDYTKPVGIIILSPGFHKDNYIDCLYHKLFFELIEFSIVNKASLEFKTQHLNGSKKFKNRAIPVAEVQENKFTIEPPSRALINSLSKLQNYDIDLIIETRKRILSFNPSIKELKFSPSTFLFGKSKDNSCIDFTFSQERENHKFNIAFRLPLSFRDVSTGDKKIKFYRMILDDRAFLRTKSKGNNEIIQNHLLLSQKALGKARVRQVTYVSAYLRIFICEELNLKSDRGWENKLARYCKERDLGNPLMGNSQLLAFLTDFSLGYYLKRI